MSRAQSWIVAVAVRLGGKVYAGHHRHAVLMNEIWRNLGNVRINQEDQGFLTNEGIFINRFQAGALAFRIIRAWRARLRPEPLTPHRQLPTSATRLRPHSQFG